ncbi:MAG: ABC transporter permease [Lewinellaceae bacterium]|nr:ABC transporter permease [Lewinellaceae bacterium]
MNLPLRIARRYLFAKKSTNVINLITGIAVFGLAVGTGALVIVLSVFNGFEDLITSMYSNFNPEIKITPVQGKTFPADTLVLNQLQKVRGVADVSGTLEEVAFFTYKDNQDFGILKGVDDNYVDVTRIDSTVQEGRFRLHAGGNEFAVLGLGLRNKLAVNIDDAFADLSIYLPKRKETGPFEEPFRRRRAYPAGTFVIQQDFDNQYVLTSLDLARELLGDPEALGALEISLEPGYTAAFVIPEIQKIIGDDFAIKDRYAQEASFMRLMQVEKWMSFAITSLMLLLVAFNLVGALWMIVLEKKKDIAMLKSMGCLDGAVRNIFLLEGLLLTGLGILAGFVLALAIYGAQKTFNLVTIPGSFVVEAYPISIRAIDFLIVALTVAVIGTLASLPPALRAVRVSALIREE